MNKNLTPTYQHTALISGAAGGLGKAFAVECASRGWDVFLTDTADGALQTLAEGLRNSYGVKVHTHSCDLTDQASRQTLFDRLGGDGITLTELINVAGVDHEGLFFDQTARQIQTIIRLNVEGTLTMIHEILPHRMKETPFHIINVCSLAGFYPMPVKATYAASKRFLLDFSLALREEVRPLGVTVTALCPAGMPTNEECRRSIESQGLAGQLTTMDVGRVANQTINAALAGKAVVIPGEMNRWLQRLGALVPRTILAKLIAGRWMTTRRRVVLQGGLP
ncbi:MAG TPA: SDR family NAD(P)-dependent oxidoreductase [Longilinea sp.]|nr:SDR family NAD(P)-dependent oxidoreductase [Longilinea sp.]